MISTCGLSVCVGMSELLAAAKAVSAGQLEGLTDAQQVRLLQLKVCSSGYLCCGGPTILAAASGGRNPERHTKQCTHTSTGA